MKIMSSHIQLISYMISALIILASCSSEKGGGRGFSMPPMPVEVTEIELQTVSDKFEAVGTIEATESITVVSEINATVISLPFTEGAVIQRGALIAQLDDMQPAAEVARAAAILDQRKASYNRIKSIVEQNAAAPQDLDDAAAALKVAEADLAVARAQLSKTRIVAPFEGIIGARKVSVGSFLRSGQTIAELANISQVRVNFSAPERYLARLKRGARVTVSTTAYPGYEIIGEIIVVEPVLDPATRSARIVASLDNAEAKFRPGMSGNIQAFLDERTNAMTIPNEAVFANGDQNFVFIVKDDSTVSQRAVTLGKRMTDHVEVLEGIESGMRVIRAGHQKVYEGARVMPIFSTTVVSSETNQSKE